MSEIEEKNKALVRRFLLAADRGDLEAIEELLALDFVGHSLNPGLGEGWEQEDDISLLSLRCSATRSRTSLEHR